MGRFPDIVTDGDLHLRPLIHADLTLVSRHFNDERVSRWLAAVVQPFGPEAAQDLLTHSSDPGENLRIIEYQGKVTGGLCIGASLWYWLAPEFWHQGLMRRALTLALAARFASAVPPLIGTCHEDNLASRALLSGLGFSLCPAAKRMFFHSTQKSEPCRDYLIASEQWHLLHPPVFAAGEVTLRPAQQKDARTLAFMLPTSKGGPWPEHEALPDFIERHRYRGLAQGLFVIVDENRRNIGMVLLAADELHLCFLLQADDIRHRGRVIDGLAGAFPAAPSISRFA